MLFEELKPFLYAVQADADMFADGYVLTAWIRVSCFINGEAALYYSSGLDTEANYMRQEAIKENTSPVELLAHWLANVLAANATSDSITHKEVQWYAPEQVWFSKS